MGLIQRENRCKKMYNLRVSGIFQSAHVATERDTRSVGLNGITAEKIAQAPSVLTFWGGGAGQ